MKRSDAIEKSKNIKNILGHAFMNKNEYHTEFREECDQVLDILASTTKQVEKVVGKIKEEIDKLDKLENQGTLIAEQYMVRADLKWFLTLLTEGE